MPTEKKQKGKTYVNHPRYGNQPIPSGNQYTHEDILWAHWRYRSVTFFPETAISANIDKQSFAIYPRSLYVDIEVHCDMCNRPFIFFAKEQQYWFEELGFWVDAHCTKCHNCRRSLQKIKYMQRQYEALITKAQRTDTENKSLKDVAMKLYQLGYIRNLEKINAIRLDSE